MSLVGFICILLLINYPLLCSTASVRIHFEKCGTKGFTCENSLDDAGRVDVVFACAPNVTEQDITFFIWQFNSPGTIRSITIQDCDILRLSLTCSGENKPINWLKVKNIKYLDIQEPYISHNPPKIIFENITYMEALPRHTFAQITTVFNRQGCYYPPTDLEEIVLKNVNIGTIHTEAFFNLSKIKTFSWDNVVANRTSLNAVDLTFNEKVGGGQISNCKLHILEPMALRIKGNKFSIVRSEFTDIWSNGINGSLYNFEFNNNTVSNLQSGAMSVLAQNIQIVGNHFKRIESGAFQKLTPGILHDSMRSFGRLIFSYRFSNNLIESLEDGGIRPDILAYKNVAADVTYTYNTLQCSCEAMAWSGGDQDLGYGYSVLKDFNMMVLDSQNSNVCNFTPCMCFGVRSPNASGTPRTPTATVF